MAIRDRFRRALRKSDDSDTASQSDSNLTSATTNTSQSSFTTPAPQITISKTNTNATTSSKLFPWGSNTSTDEEKAEKAAEKQRKKDAKTWERAKARGKRVHPSLKPLTEQNLKHQEILNQFTMTFGATNFDGRLSISGVSPCCTRPASIIEPEDDAPPSAVHVEVA